MFSLNGASHEWVRFYFIPYLIPNKVSHTSLGVVFEYDVLRVQMPAVFPFVIPLRGRTAQSFPGKFAWFWETVFDCDFKDL